MTVVTIHQPAYLPWCGYFDKIKQADTFVFLDSVQFEKNSFTNRNLILSKNGPQWLTVPVRAKNHLSNTMETLEIDYSQKWTDKHLRSLQHTYGNLPFFKERFQEVKEKLDAKPPLLVDLCFLQLQHWLSVLGIGTKVIRSSEMGVRSSKNDLIYDICATMGAKTYISGPFGRDYLDQQRFASAGINILFHEYQQKPYPQAQVKNLEFVPNLSVIDAYFNVANIGCIV